MWSRSFAALLLLVNVWLAGADPLGPVYGNLHSAPPEALTLGVANIGRSWRTHKVFLIFFNIM